MKSINTSPTQSNHRRGVRETSAQRSIGAKAWLVCSCLGALLVIAGCGSGESAIDSRLATDGYTPDKLVREIQIQFTALESPNSRRSKQASRPQNFQDDAKSDPGDGAKREELTFESAAEDIKSKIARLQETSDEGVDVLAEVIAGIEASDMSAALKEKVIAALRS